MSATLIWHYGIIGQISQVIRRRCCALVSSDVKGNTLRWNLRWNFIDSSIQSVAFILQPHFTDDCLDWLACLVIYLRPPQKKACFSFLLKTCAPLVFKAIFFSARNHYQNVHKWLILVMHFQLCNDCKIQH